MNIDEILKSIPRQDCGYGKLGEESLEHLDAVEGELFKRGTLAAADVDWSLVQLESIQVLKHIYHLSAIRGLIFSLLDSDTQDGLGHSLKLLQAVSQEKIVDLHPKSPKSKRMKLAWLKEICSQLAIVLQTTTAEALGEEQVENLNTTLSRLKEQDVAVDVLRKSLDLQSEPVLPTSGGAHNVPSGTSNTSKDSASSTPSHISVKKLDAKERAQLRRDILTMAHKITTHFPDDGAAYHMRGFVGWMEFQFEPEADEAGVTQLQPMPRAVAEQHLAVQPSLSDVLKIEERLTSSPDWFDGHKLAFDYAQSLGWSTAADAIRMRVAERLKTWPILHNLLYSNKQPMVSDEVKSWASQNNPKDVSSEADTLATLIKKEIPEDFLEAVTYLNDQLSIAADLRSEAILKLDLAQAFFRKGLTAQANMMVKEIETTLRNAQISQWDADLLNQVMDLQNTIDVHMSDGCKRNTEL